MTTIYAPGGFMSTGKITSFDEGSEEIRFQYQYGMEITIKSPNPRMIASLSQLGLHRLDGATINFIKNTIDLGTNKANASTPMSTPNYVVADVPLGFAK